MKTILSLMFAACAAVSMAQQCCGDKGAKSEAFLAEANKMMMAAEGKESCCRTTSAKMVQKGEEGCCSAKGETAKFKVFVAGQGYKYFGCADSAAKGRKELVAKGARVGTVQKVKSKVSL